MSRPRKPTELHVLTGTGRKDRQTQSEPKSRREKPEPPDHLNDNERAVFENLADQLFEAGIITKLDGMALELLSCAYLEYLSTTDVIKSEGRTYRIKTTTGEEAIKAHPIVAMRSDAWKRVKSMMAEFGMTPATRPNVTAIDPVELDPLEAYLNRRTPKDD